jgi:hypothetical protein
MNHKNQIEQVANGAMFATTYWEERRDEAHRHDGGSRSLHQQDWGRRPTLLQVAEKV